MLFTDHVARGELSLPTTHLPAPGELILLRLCWSCSLHFFFVPCSFILVSRGFGRREVKEKGLQPWRRSLTPRLCPDAERWWVMGTPGGRPGLGEVNESDVGKTFASIIGVG